MTKLIITLLVLLALSLPGASQDQKLKLGELSEQMGWVEMRLDGTLRVIIAGFDGENFLDGVYELKPGDPAYTRMLKQVGGLKYGETKPVPNVSAN